MTCSGNFEIREGTFEMLDDLTLTVTNTGSNAFEIEGGGMLNLTPDDKSLIIYGGMVFQDESQIYNLNNTIYVGGDLRLENNVLYDLNLFNVVMNGTGTQYIQDLDGNTIFYSFTIDKPSGTCYIANADINTRSLTIDQGTLSCRTSAGSGTTYDIVCGNWYNYVGESGFDEATGRVIFQGIEFMYCSSENFNELEINGSLSITGSDVVCSAYDWTSGGLSVLSGGSFTANDLLDNAVQGGFYLFPGSTINLTNSGGAGSDYVDLRGDLHISGGTMNVNGSLSWWPYQEDASIEMSDGILDFNCTGIRIDDNAYAFTDNITGGTIRTSGYFEGNRADFTPSAGTLELYGSSDVNISQSNGSTLYEVNINKSAKGSSLSPKQNKVIIDERTGEKIGGGSKSNTITLNSDFDITYDLTITSGTLTLQGNELTVGNDFDVYGTLIMDNPADVINVGVNFLHELYFHSGSIADLSNGIINIYGWIIPGFGCSFTASTNNTIVFTGINGGGPENHESSAIFGNLDFHKNPNQRTYISHATSEPIVVTGNVTIYPDNEFEMQNETMVVQGIFTDDPSSEIYVYETSKSGKAGTSEKNGKVDYTASLIDLQKTKSKPPTNSGSKGGALEIDTDFTLNGLLDVADGDVLLHGDFDIASTGTLDITTGTVVADQPYQTSKAWQELGGTINMTDGLFEISHNSMRFGSTSVNNISGGILRNGYSFSAAYAGTFQPSGGIVEFTGNSSTYIICSSGNYFNNVLVDRAGSIELWTDIDIKNDLQIIAGPLKTYNWESTQYNISIEGDWTNSGGDAAFDEGTGTVIFEGSEDSDIFGEETFYNLSIYKSFADNLVRVNNDVLMLNDVVADFGYLISFNTHTVSIAGDALIEHGGRISIQDDSRLELGNGSQVTINNGGGLFVVGILPGETSVLSRISTGTYGIEVNLGGAIAFSNSIIEYMNGDGITINTGANIYEPYTFNNTIFRNSSPSPSTILTINNEQVLTCTDVTFENTFGNTQFNVTKTNAAGSITFSNASGDFAGPEYENDPNGLVHWTDMDVELNLNVILEGPFNGFDMNTDLYSLGLIPLSQPFNSNPGANWFYTGSESVGSIPPNVVDWVLVELRDAESAIAAHGSTTLLQQACFLLSDGSVVDLDGNSNLFFPGLTYTEGLFPVIWHRNHLGVISSDMVPRVGGTYTWDFSVTGGAFSNTGPGQKDLGGGTFGMFSGDANGQQVIDPTTDLPVWAVDAGTWGYLEGDFNLNSQVNNIDKNDFLVPNIGKDTQIQGSK